jgi:DNA-directed RNA polymerase I subunit RPA12
MLFFEQVAVRGKLKEKWRKNEIKNWIELKAATPSPMPWPFCPQCGSILDPPAGDNITCDFCLFECDFNELNNANGVNEVVTVSAIRAKPAWLEDDLIDELNKSRSKKEGDNNKTKHATIEEPCPKCAHPELYFYTMQLRSVDEGSTVFYECPKCEHKFSQNN